MSTNALGQLIGRKQAIRFYNRLFGMDPLRLNRVKPGALSGQEERQDANALPSLLDLLIVLPKPAPNRFTHMPGGVIPNHKPVPLALSSQSLTTILQKLDADGTYRATSDQAQPDLRAVGIVGIALLPQDAIARQGFGVGIALFPGLLNQANRRLLALPGMQTWSGKAAPPNFIEKASCPIWLCTGVGDQPISCVFFNRYCGSGLVIQCLARFQLVPSRLRARRTLSSETSLGVKPCSKLTCAANSSVHRLVGLSKSRGLRCSRSCSPSNASWEKVVRKRWGREEPSSSTASPLALKQWRTVSTVCLWHPNCWAIVPARSPRAEASSIWQRRSTNASDERNPACTWRRSSSVKGRMKWGAFMPFIVPHYRLPFVEMH
jgi:hypothetical protein